MQRNKFIIGGVLILVAVGYLILSATMAGGETMVTVDEMNAKGSDIVGRSLRLTGAVVGDTIQYDPETLTLTFEVAHAPADYEITEEQGGLAEVLHQAVIDPNRARVKVVYIGVKPDLLRNEAQAIMPGKLGPDGVFYAEDLLLKCPTRYEEALPQESASK